MKTEMVLDHHGKAAQKLYKELGGVSIVYAKDEDVEIYLNGGGERSVLVGGFALFFRVHVRMRIRNSNL